MTDATCLVGGASTANGTNVAGAAGFHIALQSTAGVDKWVLKCIGTDERHDKTTVTLGLTVNLVTKTADGTMVADDGLGAAWIFQSQVNDGEDGNGNVVPEYTRTFGVYMLCPNGLRISALNETFENSAAYGWTKKFNDALRNALPGLGSSVTPVPNTVLLRNGAGGGELEALEITGSLITFDSNGQVVYAGGSNLISGDAGQNIIIGDGGDAASIAIETSGPLNLNAATTLFNDASGNVLARVAVIGGLVFAFASGSVYPNPTITQDQLAGNGATAGQTLTVLGQKGQNQSGGNANNNGGPVVVQGGLAGTGGGGAAGVAGSVSIQAGATLVATFTPTALAPSLPVTFALGATATISQALLANGTGGSLLVQAQSVTTGTGGNVNVKGGTGSVAMGNASLIGTNIFLEATTLQMTDLAGPSTAITFNLAALGATSMVVAAGVTGFTLKQTDNATNSATAATLTVQAPNATGTTSTGGDLALKSGTGTSQDGFITLKQGSATAIKVGVQNLAGQGAKTYIDFGATSGGMAASSQLISCAYGAGGNVYFFTNAGVCHFGLASSLDVLTIDANVNFGTSTVQFGSAIASPTIKQADLATNGGTGQTLTVSGQTATGTTSNGGPVVIKSGTGTTAAGAVTIQAGATVRFTANATGVNIYAAPAIAQQTKIANYTDSTGGTPGTTLAAVTGTTYSTDIPTIRNWIASLNKQINDLKTQLSQAGGGFAITT